MCGRVVALGAGVDPARIGERVLIEPCLREADGAALAAPWYLGSECDGGFAEFTRVAARHAHRIERGEIAPLVAATYPLSEIGAAQAAFARKAHIGKIVLDVD